jgi:hypothetical protein
MGKGICTLTGCPSIAQKMQASLEGVILGCPFRRTLAHSYAVLSYVLILKDLQN